MVVRFWVRSGLWSKFGLGITGVRGEGVSAMSGVWVLVCRTDGRKGKRVTNEHRGGRLEKHT